jgi:hypothetical protein
MFFLLTANGEFPQTRTSRLLDTVHASFLVGPMWNKADELRLSVVMGLRKGLGLIAECADR